MSCLLWFKITCRFFSQKRPFYVEPLLFGEHTIDLRWNLKRHIKERALKKTTKCAYLWRCSSSDSREMRRIVEKCWRSENLAFDNLWWPGLWPDLRNDWSRFVLIFDAFSNASYRVYPHGPVAVLNVWNSNTPGPARLAPNTGPALAK